MARNECPSWPEWLAHHRTQGVERFYIIDNNSTDGCDLQSFGPDVTVWKWYARPSNNQQPGNQDAAYQSFLARVSAQWVGIIDIDEFVFAPNERSSGLRRIIEQLPPTISQLCTPWLHFGSSGLHRQPRCITAANIYRRNLGSEEGIGKCFQRVSSVLSAHVHRSVLLNESWSLRGGECICADLRSRCKRSGFTSQERQAKSSQTPLTSHVQYGTSILGRDVHETCTKTNPCPLAVCAMRCSICRAPHSPRSPLLRRALRRAQTRRSCSSRFGCTTTSANRTR
jgi:hypothetical protein